MSGLSASRFNWVGSPTAWQQSQAWRERQAQAQQRFESGSSAANSNLFGASINLTQGLGEITARIASKRLQAEALSRALNRLV